MFDLFPIFIYLSNLNVILTFKMECYYNYIQHATTSLNITISFNYFQDKFNMFSCIFFCFNLCIYAKVYTLRICPFSLFVIHLFSKFLLRLTCLRTIRKTFPQEINLKFSFSPCDRYSDLLVRL